MSGIACRNTRSAAYKMSDAFNNSGGLVIVCHNYLLPSQTVCNNTALILYHIFPFKSIAPLNFWDLLTKMQTAERKCLWLCHCFFSIYNDAGQKGYKVVTLCNNYNSNSEKINPILLIPSFLTDASACCTYWHVNVNIYLSDILSSAVVFHFVFTILLCNFTLLFCPQIKHYSS